jgi:ketosteroid isomerase-like protein
MASANVEVVRDLVAAANERDFARALAHYAPDVELIVPSGLQAGRFTGRDAVARWFADWFGSFDHDARFEFDDIVELDASSVLALATYHARGRTSGAEIQGEVSWLYRLADGQIARVEAFETRADAETAAALHGEGPRSR